MPTDPETGETVTFTDASTDSDGTIGGWAWDFDDGGTSTNQNPTHVFTSAGTYTVGLTVTDDDSATDYYEDDVIVTAPTLQVTFVSAGSGDWGSGYGSSNDPTPSYPSGLQTDDLILLQVTVRDTYNTPTTPSGFTLLYGPDSTGTGRQWIYYKFSDGTETGSITISISGSATTAARMYAFRNVALSSFTEGGNFGSGYGNTVNAESVTTTGEKRLAVSFVYVTDNNDLDSFTSESGGNWIEQSEYQANPYGSNDACIQLQTATMSTAGSITGGSDYMGSSASWGVRAFALIPA